MSLCYDVEFENDPNPKQIDKMLRRLGFVRARQLPDGFPATMVYNKHSHGIEVYYFDREANRSAASPFYPIDKATAFVDGPIAHPMIVSPIWPRSRSDLTGVTEYEYLRRIRPDRLPLYETALAFKRQFGASVVLASSGKEIDPGRPFAEYLDQRLAK